MSDSIIYTHYRYQNGDGTSKDWAIGIAGQEIRIRYCSTGQTARLSVVPSAKFTGNTPQEEVARRVQKKVDAGYIEIGLARMDCGRLKQTQPVQETFLHWEARKPLPKEEFLTRCREIYNDLAGMDLGVEIAWHGDCLQVRAPQREWIFGFSRQGGLADDGRGGGKLSRYCGPLPVLILLAIHRAFPESLHFANDQGDEVSPTLARDDEFLGDTSASSFGRAMEIGSVLGLCLGPLRLTDTPGGDHNQSLWF